MAAVFGWSQPLPVLRPYVTELASAGLSLPAGLPKTEQYNDDIDDDAFAELAWPASKPPVAVLAANQMDFASQRQKLGWKVVVPDGLLAKGVGFLVGLVLKGIQGA
jgi:DEAD/DEAH box helicase domain-containing protein